MNPNTSRSIVADTLAACGLLLVIYAAVFIVLAVTG